MTRSETSEASLRRVEERKNEQRTLLRPQSLRGRSPISSLMPSKRKYTGKRPRKVRLAASIAAGALTAGDVTFNALTAVATDSYRLLSVKNSYSWTDIQAVIDDGLEFGLAHSDYSAAEIEECLESQASIDLGDKVAQEQANWLVRSLGRISSNGVAAGGGSIPFNEGRPLKTKLNWKMSTGDSLSLWIRNGSGVVWTTGSEVSVIGDFWVIDSQ